MFRSVWNIIFNKFSTASNNYAKYFHIQKLDTSKARRCLKSPRSLSGTSAQLTTVTLVNIMVMNGWITSFSFHVNGPSHSWDKAINWHLSHKSSVTKVQIYLTKFSKYMNMQLAYTGNRNLQAPMRNGLFAFQSIGEEWMLPLKHCVNNAFWGTVYQYTTFLLR